jgi:hypothetical protein
MLPIADQLERYAAGAADQVEPVTVDQILRPERASAGEVESTGGQAVERRPQKGTAAAGRRVAAVAAALVVAAAMVGLFFLGGGEGPSEVVTGSTPDTRSAQDPTFGYEPGWHDLDPGPLEPRQGASVSWAGDEVMVLGGERHHDGAAYNPATGEWRIIAEPPLPDGVVYATWTDAELIVVANRWSPLLPPPSVDENTPGGTPERVAAAYDPATNKWRRLAGAPEADATNLEGLIWTGSEAVLLDALAAYDPTTDQWRDLGVPPGSLGGGPFAAAWTGEALVFAGYGAPAVAHDPATGATEVLAEPPRHDIDMIATQVAAQTIGSLFVLVDDQGRVSTLDLETGAWTAETTLDDAGGICVPAGFELTDGASLWDLCTNLWLRSPEGLWDPYPPSIAGCCYPAKTTNGSVLFEWASNDDTANYPGAPYTRFSIFVPRGVGQERGTTGTTQFVPPTGLTVPAPTACEVGRYPVLSDVPETAEVSVQVADDILAVRVGLSRDDPTQWVTFDVSKGAGAPAGFAENAEVVSVLTADGEISVVETVTEDVGPPEERDNLLRRLDWVDGDVFVSVMALNVPVEERDALVAGLSLQSLDRFAAFEAEHGLESACG